MLWKGVCCDDFCFYMIELKQITVLLIIIKLLIFSDMCNFFTFIFLIFYLLINSANGFVEIFVTYKLNFRNVSQQGRRHRIMCC